MPAHHPPRSVHQRFPARGLARAITAALLVGPLAQPAAAQATVQVPAPRVAAHADAVAQARSRILAWLDKENVPGVSVAVGLDGEIVWAEGFGWADLEQHVAVSPLSRFRIGSITKALTATEALRLAQQGRLDLDAPVQRYVPRFPVKRWPVTTRQLLGHVAGIRHYANDAEMLSSEHYASITETLGIFADDSLLFEPGTQYAYSSYGYTLVSAVIEAAGGGDFLDLLRRDILAPVGMRQTVPDDVFGIIPDRVRFYDRDANGQLRNADYVDQSNKWAGGLLSTPSDLVRYGFAMLDRSLLDSATTTLAWTAVRLPSGKSTGYGLGWMVRQTPDGPIIGHNGSSIGGRSGLLIFPAERLVVAVTANVTGAELAPITMGLARLFDPAGAE